MIKIFCDYCLEEIVNPSDGNMCFSDRGHFHDRELGDCLDLWLLRPSDEENEIEVEGGEDLK